MFVSQFSHFDMMGHTSKKVVNQQHFLNHIGLGQLIYGIEQRGCQERITNDYTFLKEDKQSIYCDKMYRWCFASVTVFASMYKKRIYYPKTIQLKHNQTLVLLCACFCMCEYFLYVMHKKIIDQTFDCCFVGMFQSQGPKFGLFACIRATWYSSNGQNLIKI